MRSTKHPAKYTDALLPVFERLLVGCKKVLDPFAGTGKIHSLPFETIGVEIETEWADLHEKTVLGDATNLQFSNCEFDAICTSPTYGNRMADCHEAKDGSSRNTYTHKLGRKLNDNNSGRMQWGENYRKLHIDAWNECYRVLKYDGVFILNFKNHIRKGVEVDVFSWHVTELIKIGFSIEIIEHVKTNGNGFGQNAKLRTGFEFVARFKKSRSTATGSKLNNKNLENMRKIILAAANDLARGFLCYDRKEDEELPRGEIQKAVERGEITKEEIVAEFKKQIDEWW